MVAVVESTLNYADLADEEVVVHAQEGDLLAVEYIIHKYRNFVCAKTKTYFLIGADKEDMIQEGMIGLFKAIRDFRKDKFVRFPAFAEICITRQIITAVKTATRQKHIPLNSYVSLDKPIHDEESERTLLDVLSLGMTTSPEELLLFQEKKKGLEAKVETVLSDLEKSVLALYLNGCSYQEISAKLGRHVKSIDNALQRIKRKLAE